MDRVLDDPLAAGREALDRHAWQEAYELIGGADRAGDLTGDSLYMLSQAAWWSGHPEAVLDVAERAYGAYLAEGNKSAAARMAFELAQQNLTRMAGPIAGGWLSQAERLVADDPDDPVHGYLEWMHGFITMLTNGDPATAIAHFDKALEIADHTRNRNVQAMSLHFKGMNLCSQGRFTEGLALMDEAMVAAVGGELDPFPTGQVYCGMIASCSDRADYVRAAEWTEATTRWCERNSVGGFPGICRVHRAEIMRMRGLWPAAEEEARRAAEELPRFNLLYGMGFAFYEIGEVRRRMGDFAGADEAYSRAHEHGSNSQPGLSLLRLAQGKAESAAAGIGRALADESGRLPRVRLLAAQAEIAIAANEIDTASAASAELDSIVSDVATPGLEAMAASVRGRLFLARGDPQAAVTDLRSALQNWQEIEAPYETAEVRVLLGKSYQVLKDEDGALMEFRAARDAFERLGAVWASARTADLLGEMAGSAPSPERVKRAFVFTDIVKSTDLARAIGDEAWEDLLSWHDQTLRSVFASHGGEVANHTGDGFFVTFATAANAIEGAVSVQRVLADHRRKTGFAPVVRIGVHLAEATRRGHDYGGGEVHKAARIAALAEGWEILASDETLAEVEGVRFGEFREVALKGITTPVKVAPIEWRDRP